MQKNIFLAQRIALLCLVLIASVTKCQLLVGSGSGDGEEYDIPTIPHNQGGEDEGSGSVQESSSGSTTIVSIKPSNPDDEDDDDITFSGGGSGFIQVLDDNTKCTPSFVYCWCIDAEGDEILGTRKFIEDIVYRMVCEDWPVPVPVTLKANPPTRMADTTTTPVRKPSTKKTSRRPFIYPERTTTPYYVGTGNAEGREGEDIYRERVTPLFTHPGILAAIIGGGVVALLCALLLVMFIIYRMRKKDEGSYPLDPDAKPPRLHTYTRAPNKEFYA